MKNFFKKRWYLILIAIFVVGVIIYNNINSKKTASLADSYKIKKEDLKEELSLSGEIDADEKVTLKFQTSGRLAWVGVKEGDFVKKYQTLASLDKRDIKNRLQKYLNTYSINRNTFEQTKDDNIDDQNDLSRSIREEAKRVLENNQFSLENAVLDVEYQNLSVEYANLWTPIDGIVTNVSSPYAGVNVTPTNAEFEIVNPDTLYFSATAEQSDVINLKEGMKGKIILDAYDSDKEINGELYFISFSPKTGETGTVYELKLKMSDGNLLNNLKLGMTGDLNFELQEKKNVLSVPSRFVKKNGKKSYVMVLKNGKKEKVNIIIGDEIDNKIEIVEGLSEGQIVIDE